MNIRNRKVSGTAIILLLALVMISTVLGTIIYTLTKTGSWNVRTATGLELDYANGTQVGSLAFTVDPLGTQTQSFMLKNLANHDVNVTDNIPSSTAFYTFATNFANSTLSTPNKILKGSNYNFTITLTDISMDSTQTYSGNFAYNIVDAGPSEGPSNDSFSTTTVNYASDTNQYFGFVSDNFNSSTVPVGSGVLYSFTTQNINSSYTINGISYKLEIYDSSNNLVSTVCDGLLVAYWQNSTAYGTYGNGTHMVDPNALYPNGNITIWNSFPAPSPAGTYHLVLTYQSHNASPIVTPITWTISVDNPWQNQWIMVASQTISGAQQTGQTGTVSFQLNSLQMQTVTFSYAVVVLNSTGTVIQTIANGSDSIALGSGKGYGFAIAALTTGGPLTMLIAISNAQLS